MREGDEAPCECGKDWEGMGSCSRGRDGGFDGVVEQQRMAEM